MNYAYLNIDIVIEGIPVKVLMDIRKTPQKNKLWVHQVYTQKNTEVVPTGANGSKIGLMNLDVNNILTQDNSFVNSENENVNLSVTSTSSQNEKNNNLSSAYGSMEKLIEEGLEDEAEGMRESEVPSIVSEIKDALTPKLSISKRKDDTLHDNTSEESRLISLDDYHRTEEYNPVTSKNRDIYTHNVNKMFRKAQSLFSVPYGEARKHIKPIIEEMAAKLMNHNGHISDEDYFNLTVELIG